MIREDSISIFDPIDFRQISYNLEELKRTDERPSIKQPVKQTLITTTQNSTKVVSGKVTDDLNEGLPDVHVKVVGTTKGTITDINGNYSIQVNENDVLQFSFVGAETKKINVKQVPKTLQLISSNELLDEVILETPKKNKHLGVKLLAGSALGLLLFALFRSKEEEPEEVVL
ncbi:Outer membrane TonB-dependent transporter, utilization system for glycans and polysaccharides (PUL), SusC family [Tenacibaculum discolor]